MTQSFKFYAPVKICYNDTGMLRHVYFGQSDTFFDEGIEGYLTVIGYGCQQILAEHSDFVYAESRCRYV